jgi:hypothetical protein
MYDSLITYSVKYENLYNYAAGDLHLSYSVEYKYDAMNRLYEKYLYSNSVSYESGILDVTRK